MRHVITVGSVMEGDRVCVRIENGRAHVADMFVFHDDSPDLKQIDDAVEYLMDELATRVERRGGGIKGGGMKRRAWRIVCPACKVKSSVHGDEHQLIFKCPACDFQTTIKDEGEDSCA